jgi:hypothetical protein
MANVAGSAKVTLNVTQKLASGFLTGVPLPIAESLGFTFNVAGALADQCNLCHAKTYSFLASTPQPIDLTTITDILGATTVFARVRLLLLWMKSTNDAATLTVGNAATNAWSALLGATGTLTLRGSTATNNGLALFFAPNTTGWVVDATHKSLLMTPSAHAFDCDVIILGCDA